MIVRKRHIKVKTLASLAVLGSYPGQVQWCPGHYNNLGYSDKLKTSFELNSVTEGKQWTFLSFPFISNFTKMLMWRTLLPLMLQHDVSKFRGIITFRKSCNLQAFDHDLD